MPESAQKRKLVTKLNQANGKGTPDVATSGSVRTVGRRHRRKSGDGLINLLTPRRKRPTHGSYNFRLPESTQPEAQHCFRRQISLQPPTNTIGNFLLPLLSALLSSNHLTLDLISGCIYSTYLLWGGFCLSITTYFRFYICFSIDIFLLLYIFAYFYFFRPCETNVSQSIKPSNPFAKRLDFS